MAKQKFDQIYKSLKMSELGLVESKSGMGIGSMSDMNLPKAALLTAMAWIVRKRENPTFTYEQAEDLTQSEVNEILGMDDEEGEDAGNA